MSIEDKLMTLKMAEVDCQAASVRARDSWGRLNATFKEAATPWRIVTVGAVSGFLMGRSGGGAGGGNGIGGKLFASAAQAVITAMGASAASGVAADAAAKSAADASATATTEAIQDEAVRTGVIADA